MIHKILTPILQLIGNFIYRIANKIEGPEFWFFYYFIALSYNDFVIKTFNIYLK